MDGNGVLTDEMRGWVGNEYARSVLEVERGAIRRFAAAVEDPNPLWNDDEQAGGSGHDRPLAPPTFLRLATAEERVPFDLPEGGSLLDAGSEWEYFEPVRAGDTITAVTRLADLKERKGRHGPMLFVVRDVTYTNQRGRRVATERGTLVWYWRGG